MNKCISAYVGPYSNTLLSQRMHDKVNTASKIQMGRIRVNKKHSKQGKRNYLEKYEEEKPIDNEG